MALIKKAELIERMKAGEILKEFEPLRSFGTNRYYLNGERVNGRAVQILFKEKRLKQTKRDITTGEYVWRESDGS